jgi:hypothetical protein
MLSLHAKIQALADTFAQGVLAAVRSASLDEILGGATSGAPAPARRGPGRPRKAPAASTTTEAPSAPKAAKKGKGGRSMRRSPEDINKVIALVVDHLKKNTKGLRSEQLQKALKLDKKEITLPLEQALGEKKITKKGQKRSTTYFAK